MAIEKKTSVNQRNKKTTTDNTQTTVETKPIQTIADRIKQNMQHSPYPLKVIGNLKLKRSQMPKEDNQFFNFQLDHASNLEFTSKALRMGLTTDELARQLFWTFISE